MRFFHSLLSMILGVLCLALFAACPAHAGLNVPLSVADTAPGGQARASEPVTSGIPLPRSANVADTKALQLADAKGTPVPAQFRVMARWGGTPDDTSKPIKWVLADFQAHVPAKGETTYVLRVEDGKAPASGITTARGRNALTINTGTARFSVSTQHFNLFDTVEVGGENVLSQPGSGGLELVDDLGRRFTTLGKPELVEVEESGPLRTTVRVRGIFRNSAGEPFAPAVHKPKAFPRFDQPYEDSFFWYSCRIHFYAGKPWVRALLTIENNGSNGRTNPEQKYAPIQMVTFDSIKLRLGLSGFGSPKVATDEVSADLGPDGSFELRQWWREQLGGSKGGTLEPGFKDGPAWAARTKGGIVGMGRLNPGWLSVKGGGKGIAVGMRHFWQNFPKGYGVSPTALDIGLWPSFGYYPPCGAKNHPKPKFDRYCRDAGQTPNLYLFDAGRHKTHELLLDFGGKASAADMAERLEHPLMALAKPEWYASTGALGLIAPAGIKAPTKELAEAVSRFDRLQLALVDPKVAHEGTTIDRLRRGGPHWSFDLQHRYYGWMGFGDLLWSGKSPCALHYDWPYIMLLHGLRTGERRFFDLGVEMARHRSDIDQYHGERTDTRGEHVWLNHMAFYELDGHADPFISGWMPSRVSMNSHTWNGGLVLYYLLTGERTSWESAVENGRTALNFYQGKARQKGCASGETRMETWPMLNLVNLHRVGARPEYLQTARNIAVNRLLNREQLVGGEGYFGVGADCAPENNREQQNTMYVYAIGPLLQAHFETRDPELAGLILRMADFVKDKMLVGGDTDARGQYRPLQTPNMWQDGKKPEKLEIVKTAFFADLFAYAYRLSGKQAYLDLARQSFRDTAFYYAAPSGTYLKPSYRSRVGFLDSMFSNSETKVHGWLGRTNQIYLNTEWLLSSGALKPKDLAAPLQ